MNTTGSARTPTEDELAELLAACDEGLAQGDLAVGQTIPLDDSQLQQHLACVKRLRRIWPRQGDDADFTTVTHSAPSSLGRFQIVREIGRGGYGVVYLARDPVLDRDVAIKVPRDGLVPDEHSLARLTQEAQAVARLQHPNIVSLYEQCHVDGKWFLVSEYCDGLSLIEWIRQSAAPISPIQAAVITRQLALAVEHSHQQGVLHRDLKPGNVLLKNERKDASNDGKPSQAILELPWTPKLTDFGLAKFLNVESPAVTRSGISLGTPCYMAPEQVAGGNRGPVGPATDVYGLGTILYELLTRRPPFPEDELLAMIRRLTTEDPLPPTQLRPSIPRDLEVICLKCLQKHPRARYSSAAELAEDLRRYLVHEPILARPVTIAGRTARWVERQPVTAGLVMLLFAVVVMAFGAVTWQWQRMKLQVTQTNTALGRLQLSQKELEDEKRLTESNYRRARELVTQLTDAGVQLTEQPTVNDEGIQVLKASLKYYDEMLQESQSDPVVRREMAELLCRIGKLEWSLGQNDTAVEHLQHGVVQIREHLASTPDDPGLEVRVAEAELGLANVLRWQARLSEAASYYDASVTRLKKHHEQAPDNPEVTVMLGNALTNLSAMRISEGKTSQALDSAGSAVKLLSQLASQSRMNIRCLTELALAHEQFCIALRTQKQLPQAYDACRAALKIRRALLSESPSSISRQYSLLRSLHQLSSYTDRVPAEEMEKALQEFVTLGETLIQAVPNNKDYLLRSAGAHEVRAIQLRGAGKLDESILDCRRAIELCEQFNRQAQGTPDDYVVGCLLRCLAWNRMALQEAGRAAEATAQTRRSLQAIDGKLRPTFQAVFRAELATCLATDPIATPDEIGEAEALVREAIRLAPHATTFNLTLAIIQNRKGNYEAALEEARTVLKPGTIQEGQAAILAAWSQSQLGNQSAARELLIPGADWMKRYPNCDPYFRRIYREIEQSLAESGQSGSR